MDAEPRASATRSRAAARPRIDAGIVLILIAGLLLLVQTAVMVATNGEANAAPPATSAEAAEAITD